MFECNECHERFNSASMRGAVAVCQFCDSPDFGPVDEPEADRMYEPAAPETEIEALRRRVAMAELAAQQAAKHEKDEHEINKLLSLHVADLLRERRELAQKRLLPIKIDLAFALAAGDLHTARKAVCNARDALEAITSEYTQ